MLTQAAFFGGSQSLAPGANFDIVPQVGRVVLVTPSTTGLRGLLPDARRFYQPGGPIAWVFNLGASSFEVRDHSGTNVVATVASAKVATILLRDNSTSDGVWSAYTKTRLT